MFITAYPERFLTGERPGAGVPDLQAVSARDGFGGGQPGAVLPAQFAQPRAAGGGVLIRTLGH